MLLRFSIRFRLTAWYVLSLAVLLGLLSFASYIAMRTAMYRAVDVDLRYRLAGIEEDFRELPSGVDVSELPADIGQESTLGVLFRVFDASGKLEFQSEALTSHHITTDAPKVQTGAIAYRDAGSHGWPLRMAAQRTTFRGRPVIVEVAQPLRFHYGFLREFAFALLIALPVLVVFAAFLGYFLSGRALAPVDQIVDEARLIDLERMSQRLSLPPARDELRRLSETLNSMLDRIEVSVGRVQQFTADASHELRAPLTLIQTAAEYSLRRERSQEELIEAMKKILLESRRTAVLVDNLLLLARADSDQVMPHQWPVPLQLALRDALDRAEPLAAGKEIALVLAISEAPLEINGDLASLQRLFFILIDNALKYTQENGQVKVTLGSDASHAVVDVEDNGIGISAENLPRVFDRFWRADKARSRSIGGTGLGLSIAKWIVEKSGGAISVESTVGRGSRFTVRFPFIAK